MRVLIITKTVSKDSGWGRYSHSVIEEFKKKDLDFKVLSENNGIIPTKSFFGYIKNIFSIRKYAKEYDIVHAFDGGELAIYGYFAVIFSNKKLFINAIGTYSVAPLDKPIKGFLVKLVYKKATYIYSISNFVKNLIVKRVKNINIKTVYLGSTILPVLLDSDIKFRDGKYNINNNHYPILLTVGAIKDRKGQFETIQAVKHLLDKYPKIMYIIVGDDSDKSYVRSIVDFANKNGMSNNLKIINDAKDDEDLSYWYGKSDIFLLNSKNENKHVEGFGLVMLEACQFSKPVIGTKGTGVEEAMRDGYNGYLTVEGDISSISEAVIKVMNDYKRLSNNSRIFFNNFSWEKTACEYMDNYI